MKWLLLSVVAVACSAVPNMKLSRTRMAKVNGFKQTAENRITNIKESAKTSVLDNRGTSSFEVTPYNAADGYLLLTMYDDMCDANEFLYYGIKMATCEKTGDGKNKFID